jgi:dATP pyrophosphohydrolase
VKSEHNSQNSAEHANQNQRGCEPAATNRPISISSDYTLFLPCLLIILWRQSKAAELHPEIFVCYSTGMSHIHTAPGQVDHTVEVFIVYKDKVLLRKHDKYKIWLSVEGHIELGEDPNQAALREVKEEIGLDVMLSAPKGRPDFTEKDYKELIPPLFLNRHRISPTHEHVTHTYFATTDSDEVTPENPEDEWHWFTKAELEAAEDIKNSIKHYALTALENLSRA